MESEEVFKRAVSLGFGAVYMHTHSSQRDSALRVAHMAYRFLNGEDVDQINKDADHANAIREDAARVAKNTYPQFAVRVVKFLREKAS